jgi:hypothetical protein
MWQWTAVFTHALRQGLCPSPGMRALTAAIASGELNKLLCDGQAKRRRQLHGLGKMLSGWILG